MTDGTRSELRLALVMNGGVSLAVWMGGITHEIDLLRRASEDRSDDQGRVYEYWRQLCATYRQRVTVDIIAGTSAGGLNGAVLAAAIAYDRPLPKRLHDAWHQSAALTGEALLKPEEESPRSLLAGMFFQEEIAQIFKDIVPGLAARPSARPSDSWASAPPLDEQRPTHKHPVTLFVTATALGGRPITVDVPFSKGSLDRARQSFDFEDHRRLYRFSHDPERLKYDPRNPPDDRFLKCPEKDFDPQEMARLVCAVRASASFPAAFVPVDEAPLLGEKAGHSGHRVRPTASAQEQPATWLMDGGVLDNAPFGPVLEEVASRPVQGPYRRVIAYVVPSSGGLSAKGDKPPAPPWWQVVVQAIRLPAESDFRSDVEQLEHTLRMAADNPHRSLYERLRDSPKGSGIAELRERARRQLWERAKRQRQRQRREHVKRQWQLRETADHLLEHEYRRARLAGGLWHAHRLCMVPSMQRTLGIPACVDPDALLDKGTYRWLPDAGTKLKDLNLQREWTWGVEVAEHVVLMLLRDAQEELDRRLAKQAPGRLTNPGPLAQTLSRIRAELRALHDALDARLIEALDGAGTGSLADPPRPGSGPAAAPTPTASTAISDDSKVAKLINDVFEDLELPVQISHAVREAADAYACHASDGTTAVEVVKRALVADILVRSFAVPSVPTPIPPFSFVRLGPDIPSPVLHTYDGMGDRKLYGTRIGHFGAFADEAARASDWTWGRLDAAAHLVRQLLADEPEDRLREVVTTVQSLILEEEAGRHPGTVANGQELKAWLESRGDLLSDNTKLIGYFLGTKAGRDTAQGVGHAAFRLLAKGQLSSDPDKGPTRLQHMIDVLLHPDDKDIPRLSLPQRTLRGLTRRVRDALWRTLENNPQRLGKALRGAAISTLGRWLLIVLGVLLIILVPFGVVLGLILGVILGAALVVAF